MAEELDNGIGFSPVLIMEFIRQTTIGKSLNSDTPDIVVKFKIAKNYYDEMKAYHQQVQFIRLYDEYDENSEVLSVKTDEVQISDEHDMYGWFSKEEIMKMIENNELTPPAIDAFLR